jgi:hypothetical protein
MDQTNPKRGRTYLFPSGKVAFENVVAVCVRPSGTHRLELADGRKVIVNPGWLAVELDMDEWTF